LWRLAHGRVLPRTGSGTAALAHGGLGPRPPRPPGGLLARRQARLRRGLPRTAALPYLPRLGALPGKGLVQVDRGVPRNRCATLGVVWTSRPHHRPRRSPRLGDCPGSEPRGSGCDFLGTRSPHAGGFPGRLWLRGEDGGVGCFPGSPPGSAGWLHYPGTAQRIRLARDYHPALRRGRTQIPRLPGAPASRAWFPRPQATRPPARVSTGRGPRPARCPGRPPPGTGPGWSV
jgi:hypothetical protein